MSAVLWHIPVSHYNEKVRWALDLKGVAAERKAPPPGLHMAIALWLTRGRNKTFPVLELDDRAIGDSTAIIAALEERYPEAALYPAPDADRRRALALEDFFDEELGPHSRLLVFHELRRDSGPGMREFTAGILPERLVGNERVVAVASRGAALFTEVRYRVASEESAALARAKIIAAIDRLEAELEAGPGDYLVGNSFSVADLTAAALLTPVVDPPQGQALPDPPAGLVEFRESLRERRAFTWVEEMFARHRADPARP
jgi:glutathione S-transferase